MATSRRLGLAGWLLLILPFGCGQILGLKSFHDAPKTEDGGGGSNGGNAASGGTQPNGGVSNPSGGTAAGNLGTGGQIEGMGGSSAVGGAAGGGELNAGSGGEPATGGTPGGGTTANGGTPGTDALNCVSDMAQPIDVFTPADLDVSMPPGDLSDDTLVVVPDSGRLHIGIERSDHQYLVRTLNDSGSGQLTPPMAWTKMPNDGHHFSRGRLRAGRLELYGQVQDSLAVLQIPLGSQGIAPGPQNNAVVETLLGQKPCAMNAFPASFAVSFHASDFSFAVTCEDQVASKRVLVLYESNGDQLTPIAAGDINDPMLRVQGYVYVPGAPLIQVGDGGAATLRLGVVEGGMPKPPFSLDLGSGLSALFGITETQSQTGAQILVAALTNPGLVPATMYWGAFTPDQYADLATVNPPGFIAEGVFKTVAEVGEPGRPQSGDYGTWLVGHSKNDPGSSLPMPSVLRGTWIGPQGARLVFADTMHVAPGAEIIRRGYGVRVGLASTFLVWLENVPDPNDVVDPNTPKNHRVRAQRFICTGQ